MNHIDDEAIRAAVRDHYASVTPALTTIRRYRLRVAALLCNLVRGGSTFTSSLKMGYSPEDILNVPEGADLGLCCGKRPTLAN